MFDTLRDRVRQTFKLSGGVPTVNTSEAAWSESSMYVSSNFVKYNPDALLSRKGYAIYQKMMTDEQIKAVVRFKRDAITSRDWQFTFDNDDQLSEDEAALRIAIFTEIIEEMEAPFSDALNGIMSAMYNGFSMTEKVQKAIVVDGKTWIGIKRLKLRPCDTFFFHVDEYGNIERITQKFESREQELDIEKFIHYIQNPDYDEHYGRSELRECYRAWFSKDMVIKFQNIHLERFAAGFIWAAPKEGKTITTGSAEFAALKDVMMNLQATSSIILPSGIDLNIEHPATTDAFERAISQHDKSIAKALLVPNLMGISEQGSTGSYSQSQTQLEAFLWTLDADATRLEAVINKQLFKELGDLNFGDGIYPDFKFKPVSDTRKLEVVKIWKDLVMTGAVQATDTDEAYIRDALEIPKKAVIEGDAPDLILNGAQTTSLVGIVTAVGAGSMSPEAAKAIITAIFPISEEQASAMVDKAKVEPLAPVVDPNAQVPPVPDANGNPVQTALDPAGNPIKPMPDAGKPTAKPLPDETIVGKMGVSISAFSKAMKRVDFVVIANKADNLVGDTVHELATINSEAVARLVLLAEELKLGTAEGNPDDLKKIVYTPAEVSKLKSAATKGLQGSWDIGISHAKKEMAKAKGAAFKSNDMALQDLAAKYLKAKGYTLAGDISGNTQKKIQNILAEGTKVSKTAADVKKEIYKALEADGMLTEEAVVEALGAGTVKNASARIDTAIRTTSFEAINEARYDFFSDPELAGFVEALEYSAILDDRTTEICSQLDGATYGIDAEEWSTFRPPNHFNCRSILIPVTIQDTWTPSESPTVNPQKGFGFTRKELT
jgi:SPP1 gp7 family putative phage head morphogenesis protein